MTSDNLKLFDREPLGAIAFIPDPGRFSRVPRLDPAARLEVFDCKGCGALVSFDQRARHAKFHLDLERSSDD